MRSGTELRAAFPAIAGAVFMIAQQVGAKATRDALFLSQFEVAHLPKMVIAGALVSLACMVILSALLARHGPGRVVPVAFGVGSALFFAEWVALPLAPRLTALLLYLHVAGTGAVFISGFWSLVNERLDPHSARPQIPRIAAGAALGGVLGGVLANVATGAFGFPSMLLLLAGLNGGTMALLMRLAGDAPAAPGARRSTAAQALVGLGLIARTPYLRAMATLLVSVSVVAALLDFALKSEAAARYADRESLLRFFTVFYSVVGVLGFLVQTLAGPRVLRRFGIGPALAALPAAVLIGAPFALAGGKLLATTALRGVASLLANSLFRSGFELLYAPLAPGERRPTKTFIDVGGDRLGDLLGGAAILVLVALFPSLTSTAVVVMAAVGAALALVLALRLHRGYISQLARTLRTGAVELAAEDVVDATTERILAESTALSEREALAARIRERKLARAMSRPPPPDPIFGGEEELVADGPPLPAAVEPSPTEGAPEVDAVAGLTSADPGRIRETLHGEYMAPSLAPFLVRLLDHPELAADARMELRWIVPNVIGQLTDALLDPDVRLTVRRRIPGVMEVSHNPRVVEGLALGLRDEAFEVRYSAARALARMRSRDPELSLAPSVVYDVVRREVSVPGHEWMRRGLAVSPAEGHEPGHTLSLDHLFTVLGLVLERRALQPAMQALLGGDPVMRGTALEYLANVLPDDVRLGLWRHLGVPESTAARPRGRRTRDRRRG